MHRFLSKVGRTLATLLIAVMVIVPLSDAFACALEIKTPYAAETIDVGVLEACNDAVDGDRTHAACAHSHCHHSSSSVPAGLAVMADAFARGHILSLDDTLQFHDLSEGLMRPPRV